MEDHYLEDNEKPSGGPAEAMEAFFGNFGKLDTYSQIVIEEFMEMLLNEK